MDIHEEYAKLRTDWIKTNDDTKLLQFFETDEYRRMSYIERNRDFITGSKAKRFYEDPHWYKLEFVDEMKSPYIDDQMAEQFAIGLGVDVTRAFGEDTFNADFAVVQRRVGDIGGEIAEQKVKLLEAQQIMNKDGSRSKVGINKEETCKEKIKELEDLKGKIQLTGGNYEMIQQILAEFKAHPLLPDKPKKKFIVANIGSIPCKAELDNYKEHFTDKHCKANDFHAIRDDKTCANIYSVNADGSPQDYWLPQLTFYQLLVEEHTFKGEPTWDGRPVCGIIDAVDKHGFWSRGRAFYYNPELLRSERGRIMEKIMDVNDAEKTGKFYKSKDFQGNCPFYGCKEDENDIGYGRESNYVLV